MTAVEIKNAARDVFLGGTPLSPDFVFPAESPPRGYDNGFENLSVSEAFAIAAADHAEAVAAAAVNRMATLLPSCKPTPATESRCATEFIASFAPKVYRRPVAQPELAALGRVYSDARAITDWNGAIAAVMQVMLQSPYFLFRTELGDPAARAPKSPLLAHERAAALSFFLWRSTPDDALLAAAASGALLSADGVAEQARRMLADDRAKAMLRDFVSQWLELGGLAELSRDKGRYPDWNATLAQQMTREVAAFVDQHAWTAQGFRELLTSNKTTVEPTLGRIYGLNDASTGTATLDPAQRGGLLTSAAFLSSHAPASTFSPVFYGRFVRSRLLCQVLPDPPPNVPSLPAATVSTSPRERFAAHVSGPDCKACHSQMDPIGFGFERYDGVGRYAAGAGTGEGQLIDTDVDGPFHGPVELAARLATSRMARACFVANLFEFAQGRPTTLDGAPNDDQRALGDAVARFGASDGDLTDLIVSLTRADTFLFRDSTALPEGI